MKRFKNISPSNKRKLAIAGVSLAILAVGGTIAYNQAATIFNNHFRLASDEIEAFDIVPLVEDWQPCQEYPKTAGVKNKNDTPRYVRMKINDYWRVQNSQQTDHETSDLAMSWTDGSGTHKYAFYNTQNDDKWTLANDGYYYYNEPLAPGATTESLLKSAMFNCDANITGEMTYSQDGLVAESNPSPYVDSEYHIYVIFEISDEPLTPSRLRLYDEVARQTLGSDAGIDFNATAVNRDFDDIGRYFTPVEEGVYTYSRPAAGEKAVYYYRGRVQNNFVKYNNICWNIVRTTGTGGTKIVYSGPVKNDGTCSKSGTAPYYTSMAYTNNIDTYGMYNPSSGLVSAGYMFNANYHFDGYTDGQYVPNPTGRKIYSYGASLGLYISEPVAVSRGISYENGVYKLTGDTAMFPSANYYDTSTPRYYYTCFSASANDTCESAGFIISSSMSDSTSGIIFHWPLENGKTGDDAKREFLSNERDSQLKMYLDQWYESNLADETDKFEDTQWCNDRKITSGPYALLDDHNYEPGATTMAGYDRVMQGTPSVDCEREDDKFTVSSENGNGKLKHPMAIITADELMLSGYKWVDGQGDWRLTYLYGSDMFSMTPAISAKVGSGTLPDGIQMYSQRGSYDVGNLIYTNNLNEYGIRPMVSFKYDTYVAGGTGTATDPYTLEW